MDTGADKPVASGTVVTGDALRNPGALALADVRVDRPALLTAFGLAP